MIARARRAASCFDHEPAIRARASTSSTPQEKALETRARRWSSASRIFCSGCPHNTSTKVPEGSRAHGRHRLPLHGDLDGPQTRRPSPRWAAKACPGSARRRSPTRSTSSPTSATAPTSTPACWRSAPPSRPSVNITYKILYNDAVAMTGGQPVDGPLVGADDRAPGRGRRRATRIVVVTDEPGQVSGATGDLRRASTVHHRDELDARAARAARGHRRHGADLRPDLRRREAPPPQARRVIADPAKRVVINELVCEGCGDCGVQVELPVGRAGRDRVRPQAHDRPVLLQQGLLLRRTASARASSRSKAASCGSASAAARRPPASRRSRCPSRALPGCDAALRHAGHRHRRHRRRDDRRAARHGRAPRRQGLPRARHDGPRAEERRGDVARAHRRAPEDTPRGAHRRRRRRPACSAATWWSAPAPTRSPRCSRASRTRSSTTHAHDRPADFMRESRPRIPAGQRCAAEIAEAVGGPRR